MKLLRNLFRRNPLVKVKGPVIQRPKGMAKGVHTPWLIQQHFDPMQPLQARYGGGRWIVR